MVANDLKQFSGTKFQFQRVPEFYTSLPFQLWIALTSLNLQSEVMSKKESERAAQEREAEANKQIQHLTDQVRNLLPMHMQWMDIHVRKFAPQC